MTIADSSRVAELLGDDHRVLGAVAVSAVSRSLAVAMSAGARQKDRPPLTPNEDACAVVHGSRADLLVVADAHHGSSAASRAVATVLELLGDDPPPPGLTGADLERIVFEVGRRVGEMTAERGTPQPRSRTTLALALASPDTIQWASFGDSLVVVGNGSEACVLGTRRESYLGYSFVPAEVSVLLDHGVIPRSADAYVLLATDGLLAAPSLTIDGVCSVLMLGREAEWTAERIISIALEADVADAISVAVASPQTA